MLTVSRLTGLDAMGWMTANLQGLTGFGLRRWNRLFGNHPETKGSLVLTYRLFGDAQFALDYYTDFKVDEWRQQAAKQAAQSLQEWLDQMPDRDSFYLPGPTTRVKFETCPECTSAWVKPLGQSTGQGNNGRKFCSEKCRHMAQRRYKRVARKRWKTARRQQRRDAPRDLGISWKAVAHRAGWLCEACGKKVHHPLGIWSPDQATVDHKVPLSKGGCDTWDNVQCLCAMCNSIKGAYVGGEVLC